MGNGEAKEPICMTHGYELKGGGNAGVKGRCKAEEKRGEK